MSTQNMFQQSRQAYTNSTGTSGTGRNVLMTRNPTVNDTQYELGTFWQNTSNVSLWYLNSFTSTSALLQAAWIQIDSSINGFIVQTGTTPVTPDINGDITFNGAVVAAGTNPVRTDGTAASTMALEVQISQAIAATDATKIGLSVFNSAMFSVDANGFVSLAGGGLAIDSVAMQTGTSPIVPTGAGLITLNGAVVAAGTNPIRTDGTGANTGSIEIQISQAIAATDATKIGLSAFDSSQFTVDANGFVSIIAGADISTINGDTGSVTGDVVTFNANSQAGSSVSFSGSVTTMRLNVTDATQNTIIGDLAGNLTHTGQFNTGIGRLTLSGLTTGMLNFAGGNASLNTLTTGTSNVAVGANSLTAATSASNSVAIGSASLASLLTGSMVIAIGDAAGSNYTGAESSNIVIGNAGVLAESNAIHIGTQGAGSGQQNTCFIAGITGVSVSNLNFVTINTATGQLGSQSSSGLITTWSDQSGSFTAVVGNGYFITGASTPTMPASPSQGDTIAFILDAAATVTITGNTGQPLRVGGTISAAAGTCASSTRGNSVTFVYRSTGTTWIAKDVIGTWTLT